MRTVTLYGRPGCHLCEEARDLIVELGREGLPFRFLEVDIEGDEELHRRLLESIPVIEIDGERVAELLVDADALRARLDTLSS